MFQTYPWVETEQYRHFSSLWHKRLALGESISVIFPLLGDRQQRLAQWADSLEKSSLYPIIMNIDINWFDEVTEFEKYITNHLPLSARGVNLKQSLEKLGKKLVNQLPPPKVMVCL